MEFIDGLGTEGFGVRQRGQLGPAGGDGIETRDAGAALRYRVGVVEIEVVDKVVAGEQASAGISIDAHRAFVIADDLIKGRRSKAVGGI